MAGCETLRERKFGHETMNIETPRKKLDLASAIAEGDRIRSSYASVLQMV